MNSVLYNHAPGHLSVNKASPSGFTGAAPFVGRHRAWRSADKERLIVDHFGARNQGQLAAIFALLGWLIVSCATMANVHTSPHTVFQAEWFAAFGCLLAGYALWSQASSATRLGCVALSATLLLGVCLLRPTGNGSGYVFYLLLFLLCYGIGQRQENTRLAAWMAGGLLLCAVLQSLAGVAQLTGWNIERLVMQKIYRQAFGNIGQANHYTDLIFLGLASLCYLRTVQRLPLAVFVCLAAWLCLSGAASASRGAWLYTGAFIVLGSWGLWRSNDPAVRRGALGLLVTAALSVVAQILVSYGDILSVFGVTSSLARASDAGSNGQRLYDWHAAWLAIQAKPWWGEGPATFYKLSIDAMAKTGPTPFSKFAEHAHNLPLQLAAEFGVPVAILVVGSMLYWYLKHLLRKPSTLSLWALSCVAVTGLHSMVEYPLWYVYFLAPMGLCIGALDAQDETLPSLRLSRGFGQIVCVIGVAVLSWNMADWMAVRSAYLSLNEVEPEVSADASAEALATLESVSSLSMFAPIAESLRLQAWRPESGGAEAIAERCERTWPYKPGWYMMMRCGEAYAISGYRAALDRLLMAACEGFPKHHAPLQAWATKFDARNLASIKISGRVCLHE